MDSAASATNAIGRTLAIWRHQPAIWAR